MSNHDTKKRVCIGKIAGAHGVKGLVKIKPFCDDLSLLNGEIFIDETSNETIKITLKNNVGKYTLAEAGQITTREQAERTKHSLYVTRETLSNELDKDEFYVIDLIGINAYNGSEILGKIIAVSDFGAGDLLEIKPKNGESYFVPFDDKYIESMDLEEKKISLKDFQNFILD